MFNVSMMKASIQFNNFRNVCGFCESVFNKFSASCVNNTLDPGPVLSVLNKE